VAGKTLRFWKQKFQVSFVHGGRLLDGRGHRGWSKGRNTVGSARPSKDLEEKKLQKTAFKRQSRKGTERKNA